MRIDEDKIDDTVLALLWLTLHNERCAWKGFDWATTDRFYQKVFISVTILPSFAFGRDPASRSISQIRQWVFSD